MPANPVEVSPLIAARGPEVRFSNVKAERSGATIDVTFDVAWQDSWGPGQRGTGFSKNNWDAVWVFFKYRLADPRGNQVQIDIPLLTQEAEALVSCFDHGGEGAVQALIGLTPQEFPERVNGEDNPWLEATVAVRTEQPGAKWTLDVRDSPKAPTYRVDVQLLRLPGQVGPGTLRLTMLRSWKHARILSVQDSGNARVDPSGDGAGVFVRQEAPGARGPAKLQGVRLRCALMDLPMNIEPEQSVELWPFGIEMVYVPEEPFWLGDPRPHASGAPRNCFYNSLAPEDASNRAYEVRSEKVIQVGPPRAKRPPREVDQILWYDNDDDARGAGDHARIHGLDTLPPHERWKEGRIPKEFPKGFQAYYVMKRRVTQGQYATFINALDGGTHPDRFGQLVRYSWDGAGTHRGTIDIPGPDLYTRVAARPYRACNHLCWADAMAFAAWAALRPMTELEYEKACRGPSLPVPGEFAWGVGPVPGVNVIAKEILGHEDGTEIVVGNVNINNKDPGFKGGDGGGGPVRDDAFDLRRPAAPPDTFWLNNKAEAAPAPRPDRRGERVCRGLSYYGIAALSGNLWELCVTVATREGRNYRGDHGRGEVTEHGEAPSKQLGWPDQTARSVSWRGGSWFTSWTRGQVAARPYGSGAPGFFHRSNDAGFRGARTAPTEEELAGAPSVRSRERSASDKRTLVRSRNPDKLLAWLPPSRARAAVRTDPSVCAALFDMSEHAYMATKDSIDVLVGRTARELLHEDELLQKVKALPFLESARILAIGDDCLDDRHSWVEILRYLLEVCLDQRRLSVINAGVRDDTTTQMIPRLAALVRGTPSFKYPDLVVCQAGVSDARRFLGMGRTQVTAAETAANLEALRALAAPMTQDVRHTRNPPGPSWLWLSPPGVKDDAFDAADPPTWHLEDQDLAQVASSMSAVAAKHPDDLFIDLHAEGLKIDQHTHVPTVYDDDVDGGRPPPAYVGLLHLEEHKKVVRRVVQALSEWAEKRRAG